jgi:hypothetical protein
MRAALIGPCRRRALRHPVPEAPEPAFIVFRARRHAIFAPIFAIFFYRANSSRVTVHRDWALRASRPHLGTALGAHRLASALCRFEPLDVGYQTPLVSQSRCIIRTVEIVTHKGGSEQGTTRFVQFSVR